MARNTPKSRLFFRPEHNQQKLAVLARGTYDVAVIPARYIAPFPGRQLSLQPTEGLVGAARSAGREVLIDPGTAALMSNAVVYRHSARRLRVTPAARAVELPLTVDQLSERQIRDRFVDACLQGQSGASFRSAPYVDFAGVDDPKFALNLKMLERTVRAAGVDRSFAIVQLTLPRLRVGALLDAAPAIAETGVKRVLLRVRDFGESVDGEDLWSFLGAQDAYLASGLEVIVDCAGRLGPICVHEGASGFVTGTMFFRKVAKELLAGGGGGGARLPYELYGAWSSIDRDDMDGSVCPVAGCTLKSGCELNEIRIHNLHVLRHLARELEICTTSEVIARLRESQTPLASAWANVLARRTNGGLAAGDELPQG